MWNFKIALQSRHKGYCVKSVISLSNAGTIDQLFEKLSKLRSKLEMIIPRSLKPKFTPSMDGLVVIIELERANEAGRVTHEMEDYIKSAIIAL
ncbi:MAG: hypothetical protein LW823_02375 [Rickettsiales bacterium]|jgi:hypothetical protein|nr:hypothetical protein [Rickettsiales bacterium]